MPRRQYSHLPHEVMQEISTRSPGLNPVTADPIDDAHAFMAEDAAGLAGGDVTLEDVQIGAADGCLCNPDNCIRRRAEIRPDMILKRLFVRPSINLSEKQLYS
jgi:hypothetical protein